MTMMQALEMDELQQEAAAAARLAEEAEELRAAEAAAQLKLAEVAREAAALQQRLASVSERAASRASGLEELQRQLKQVRQGCLTRNTSCSLSFLQLAARFIRAACSLWIALVKIQESVKVLNSSVCLMSAV